VDFASATAAYEEFLRQHIRVVEEDLAKKHAMMRENEFAFFRATYYIWAQLFPIALPDLMDAPQINTIGDLHLENFGTFLGKGRRLVWGVNDFDESSRLPYTNDLVRLATSAIIGTRLGKSSLKQEEVCITILAGYVKRMKKGTVKPFILKQEKDGDDSSILERMVKRAVDKCKSWREKMAALTLIGGKEYSFNSDAVELLNEAATPKVAKDMIFLRRVAGLGSLGHRRIVAVSPRLVELENKIRAKDCMGYELKETGPPAVVWLATEKSSGGTMLSHSQEQLINNDPSRHFRGNWVIRRIAPECIKLELSHLPMSKIERILHKMGAETANMHIMGASAQAENKSILKDLENRQPDWLENACSIMADRLSKDWRDYNTQPKSS
jgi:hypothetical protein